MELIILIIHVILALGIIGVVLLQPPESSSLGGLGGANPMAGNSARGQGNILTRMTAVFATGFIITSLILVVLASQQPEKKSILDAVPAVDAANADDAAKAPATEEKPVDEVPSVPLSQ